MAEQKDLRIGLLGFGSMGRTHTWAVRNLPFFFGALPFQFSGYFPSFVDCLFESISGFTTTGSRHSLSS